ncbi:MAG: hypothetical protein FWF52_00270 [Candidatus Azobacteroides sp.]|nr:hypothetical protein [Candidatus Azobacteroides sp.]
MTWDCTRITNGLVGVKCNEPTIPGTGSRVILINYSDIDRKLSTIEDNVITLLALKQGLKGYEFVSLNNSIVGEISYNKTTYFGNWQHDLTLRIFAKNDEAKKFVNKLNGSLVVAVVENKENGPNGEVKYELYGWDAGLELNEATAATEMAESVVYQFKLGSGTNSKESSLPKSVFKTDLTQTEDMLNSLVA